MLDGLLCGRVDDFRKQAVALVVHGEQFIGNHRLGTEPIPFRGVLARAVLVHHVHVAVGSVGANGLAGLHLDQVGVPLHDAFGLVFASVVHTLSPLSQIRLPTLNAVFVSISANALALASTISLNFPSGKFSSCVRYA